MITTFFEDYCQNCPDISPTAEQLFKNGRVMETVIICDHRERCEVIARTIRKAEPSEEGAKGCRTGRK